MTTSVSVPALEQGFARTRDGVRIAYRRTAARPENGSRIVLVHSLALDASVWDEVIPQLAPAAEVLALDCRGHGRSDKPAGPYTVQMFADDLADVLDHVGWRDAVVAGCSMGGCVAQAFAAHYPARVRGLVLIDTTAWYGADAPVEWRKRAATAKADGLTGMAAFQTTRWFGDRFRSERPERVKAAMEVFTANDLDCYAATCAMLGDADLRPWLADFHFPVSVIVGEEDYATPVAAARSLQAAIPGATLQVLPSARHLTPIECPDVIAQAIGSLTSVAFASG
ncbi:alpha/beta hydrolase [Bradyrhizobium prioriisuperbiae]|uniref:alpha/beta fold hydrolase n=1 Tax=Bradyrhizobium prioriisuperbiae TaxID=2854389 RepID=UPI0028EFA21E|nr:alpha/beta hydrolase [Bradyrhizobium prioritasuperba]